MNLEPVVKAPMMVAKIAVYSPYIGLIPARASSLSGAVDTANSSFKCYYLSSVYSFGDW